MVACICLGVTTGAWAEDSPWDKFVPPPDEKFDWIQLTNGEWLKGELKALYNYTVEFDSDELDLQEFDLEDVKRIRTHKPYNMRIEDNELSPGPIIVRGIVNMVDDKVMVTVGDETREYARDQVVSIAQTDEKKRNLWSGKFSVGANFRGGNTDTTDLNVRANAKRRTASSLLVVDYIGNYSETESIETSNNHRLDSYRDVILTKNFFWRQLRAEYFRDKFKNIENQFSLLTGLGYHIIYSSETKWDVSVSLGARYTKFVSVPTEVSIDNTTPAFGAGTMYDMELTSWMDFLLEYSFQVVDSESGRYTHHFITTLSNDLIGDIDLDFSFVWDRTEKPQPDSEGNVPDRDDFQMIVAVSYDI
jgi:putative salt-induced outer membrane protein YdiY